MKILILGATGLLGHNLYTELLKNHKNVFATIHAKKNSLTNYNIFSSSNVFENIDVLDYSKFEGILIGLNPDVILNCVGITKRREQLNDYYKTIYINSLFPHKLAAWAISNNKRLIHFSTDCVFNGFEGNYNEESIKNATDLYGITKGLGEINIERSLTIRSSFIGLELYGKTEFLEWILSQNNKQVYGFTKLMYSGISVKILSKIIIDIIDNYHELSGLYNLAIEEPISKYDLICLARDAFKLNLDIIPKNEYVKNMTLNGTRLSKLLNLKIPSWNQMMFEIANK